MTGQSVTKTHAPCARNFRRLTSSVVGILISLCMATRTWSRNTSCPPDHCKFVVQYVQLWLPSAQKEIVACMDPWWDSAWPRHTHFAISTLKFTKSHSEMSGVIGLAPCRELNQNIKIPGSQSCKLASYFISLFQYGMISTRQPGRGQGTRILPR